MKKVIGKIIYTALFLACFVFLFAIFIKVFHFKFGKALETYKKLPEDTVDVLIVGSSHTYRNISPAVLYDQGGYSAYILGTPSQPLWNSYYMMEEALKTQHPKVIIAEAYKYAAQKEYYDDAITLKAISGMGFSKTLFEDVNASVEDPKARINFVLGFPWYHSRYKELGLADFRSNYNDPFYDAYLGSALINKPEAHDVPVGVGEIKEVRSMSEKHKIYLDKMVDLAKKNDCELVFVIVPFYEKYQDMQPYYNWLKQYAEENGVEYLNFFELQDAPQLDGTTDFARGNHLSRYGAEKVSVYLAEYLKQKYSLDDHRGDEKYQRWQRNLELYKAGPQEGVAEEGDANVQ